MALRSLFLDGIRPRVMVGLVPVLMEQLADGYMKDRFCAYMEDKIARARTDMDRFREDPPRLSVAGYWLETFETTYHAYTDVFYRDILGTLKWLQDEGAVEVLTSAATHGFLPLMASDARIHAQVHVGVETYRNYFDHARPVDSGSRMRLPAGTVVGQGTAHAVRHRRMARGRGHRLLLRRERGDHERLLRGEPPPGGDAFHGPRLPAAFGRGGVRPQRGDGQTGVVPGQGLPGRPLQHGIPQQGCRQRAPLLQGERLPGETAL
jgi:hypothetical protein